MSSLSVDYSTSGNMSSYTDYINDMINVIKDQVYPDPYEWIVIVTYLVIFLFSVIGNSLVCLTVLQNEQMRTVTNLYIVNLSIADILVTVICIPSTITYEVSETWFFGPIACYLIHYLQIVCVGVSIFTLTFIAVDRYLAICRPFKYKINRSRTVVLIAIAWLLGIVVALPLLFVNKFEEDITAEYHHKKWLATCSEVWSNSTLKKLYHVGLALILYIIPLSVITLAYTLVCSTLWSGIPTEEKTNGKVPDKKERTSSTSTDQTQTENRRKVARMLIAVVVRNSSCIKSDKKERTSSTSAAQTQTENRRKVARMLIAVVVLFAVCYFAMHVFNLLKVFGVFEQVIKPDHRDTLLYISMASHWLVYLNSAVNPIIYNFLSAKFRQEFKALCLCCCRRAKKRTDQTTDARTNTEYLAMSCKKSGYDSRRIHVPVSYSTAVHTV